MKVAIIVFVCFFAAVFARPSSDAEIVQLASEVGPESYSYNVDTSDGTHHDESGQLKGVGTEQEAIVVKGSYHWVDEKTGQEFTVNYVADETGFHPVGAHLPVA